MRNPRYRSQQRAVNTTAWLMLLVAGLGAWLVIRALRNDGVDNAMNSNEVAVNTNAPAANDPQTNSSTSQEVPLSSANYAAIVTSLGPVYLQLFPEDAPKTVQNFVTLARRGYYDNQIFHRIVRDFVAQGGDPRGDGAGGTSVYGDTFADEINQHKMVVGSLAMANRGPNTNGSQFFLVTTRPQPHLDGLHTVFGQVVEDTSILRQLNEVETRADRPVVPVQIKTVVAGDTLEEVKEAVSKLNAS